LSPILIRKIHKYSGLFFAPAILFFCVTGLIQTYNLHKVRPDQTPPDLVLRVAALHKDQTTEIRRKAPPRPAMAAKPREPKEEAKSGTGQALLKLFVALTSVSLAGTTLIGVYLAFQARRERALVGLVLGLGLVVPVVLILLV